MLRSSSGRNCYLTTNRCRAWPSALLTGGDDGVRTHDPLLAGQVLSQLSYTPIFGVSLFLNDCNSSSDRHPRASCCRNSHNRSRAWRPALPAWSLKIEQQAMSTRISVHDLSVCLLVLLYFKTTIRQSLNVFPDHVLHRKEVIQPHLPIRLPCYDLTPIIRPTFDCCLLAVSSQASGVSNFHGLTGGVYKARERIHRGMLIRDY